MNIALGPVILTVVLSLTQVACFDALKEPDSAARTPQELQFTSISPGIHGTTTEITIYGDAAQGADVRIYSDADCTHDAVAAVQASPSGSFLATVEVAPNSSTTFRGTVAANGKTTGCSTARVTYTNESEVGGMTPTQSMVDLMTNPTSELLEKLYLEHSPASDDDLYAAALAWVVMIYAYDNDEVPEFVLNSNFRTLLLSKAALYPSFFQFDPGVNPANLFPKSSTASHPAPVPDAGVGASAAALLSSTPSCDDSCVPSAKPFRKALLNVIGVVGGGEGRIIALVGKLALQTKEFMNRVHDKINNEDLSADQAMKEGFLETFTGPKPVMETVGTTLGVSGFAAGIAEKYGVEAAKVSASLGEAGAIANLTGSVSEISAEINGYNTCVAFKQAKCGECATLLGWNVGEGFACGNKITNSTDSFRSTCDTTGVKTTRKGQPFCRSKKCVMEWSDPVKTNDAIRNPALLPDECLDLKSRPPELILNLTIDQAWTGTLSGLPACSKYYAATNTGDPNHPVSLRYNLIDVHVFYIPSTDTYHNVASEGPPGRITGTETDSLSCTVRKTRYEGDPPFTITGSYSFEFGNEPPDVALYLRGTEIWNIYPDAYVVYFTGVGTEIVRTNAYSMGAAESNTTVDKTWSQSGPMVRFPLKVATRVSSADSWSVVSGTITPVLRK